MEFEGKVLRFLAAVLAGAQVLTASTALTDLLGMEKAAIVALVVGALQIALTTYKSTVAPEAEPEAADE